jgi:hypothetical protein
MSGHATVPIRECDGCGQRTVCRGTDDGRLCSLCLLTMELCDAVGKDPSDGFKRVIVDASTGTPPTFETMYELLGETVGEVVLYLIEHPHHLRTLATEATERAADSGRPTQGGGS